MVTTSGWCVDDLDRLFARVQLAVRTFAIRLDLGELAKALENGGA